MGLKQIIIFIISGVLILGGIMGGAYRISQEVFYKEYAEIGGDDIQFGAVSQATYLRRLGNIISNRNAAWDFSWGDTATSSADFSINAETGHVYIPGLTKLGMAIYDSSRNITDLYHLVDKRYVDEAVTALGARYYMLDDASGEADYKECSTSPSAGGEESVSGTDLSDDDYIQGWIAPNTNEPDKLIIGVYNWRIYAEKTGGQKTLRLYWKLVERKNDDSEVVIGTSVLSNEITSGKNSYIIPLTLSSDYDIANDSYVVGKIYADVSGGGSTPSIALYYEGDSHSHWQIPVNTEILNNMYVNVDGDTMTGVHDFGGATSLEIPNGAALTLDANGEVIIDTTDNQLVYYAGGEDMVLTATRSFGAAFASVSFDIEPKVIKKFLEPVTITAIHCIADGGTSVPIDVQECDSAGANCATVDAAITCDTDGATDDGSLSNGGIDANDWVYIDIGSPSGEVNWVTITVFYKYDRE